MVEAKRGHVIVFGNEKGGSGKSTAAVNLIVGLLRSGRSVAAIDLDTRQGTLSRYLENRRAYGAASGLVLPMPGQGVIKGSGEADLKTARIAEVRRFRTFVERFARAFDVIVIDTPGNNSVLTRLGHSYADTLVTPLNDSFIDLDVLAAVDAETMTVSSPSHYAEMVWEQKKTRARRDGESIDWIVMRNRLSSLDAHNKRQMERLLGELTARIGFRAIPGFGERVIFRELFHKGLTVMDLQDLAGGDGLTLSQVAARQEVRALVEAVRLA